MEEIETQLKASYDKRRSKQEANAISKIMKDPKAFFSFAKRFSKAYSDIGPFYNMDGNPVVEAETIVEILRNQYDCVFSNQRRTQISRTQVNYSRQMMHKSHLKMSYLIDRTSWI